MNLPSKFTAYYECECGESGYEIWNFAAPRLILYCDDCEQETTHEFKYLEHKVWEWKRVQEIWAEEGGLTYPKAVD